MLLSAVTVSEAARWKGGDGGFKKENQKENLHYAVLTSTVSEFYTIKDSQSLLLWLLLLLLLLLPVVVLLLLL